MGALIRFDGTFYLGQSGVVRERARERFQGSALLDYLWLGASERRSPTTGFDEAYYLASNPDVAAALRSAEFVCGYHHYLRNGELEGRRAVPPGPCCVIDAGRAPADGGPAAALIASAIQRCRAGWRVQVSAGWKLPAGAGLHPWVEWLETAQAPTGAGRRPAAGQPNYVVYLGEPTIRAPEDAGVVAVTIRGEASSAAGPESGVPLVSLELGETATAAELSVAAERIAAALEIAAQFKGMRTRSRLIGDEQEVGIGTGRTIAVAAGDGPRLVTVAVDLPAARGASREKLVLETAEGAVALEPAVGHPAQTVVRIGANPTRIVVRPRKAGYPAASRIALARIEAAPVDLVTAPTDAGERQEALEVIDLNTDLSRVKRELGRFLTKADAAVAGRPALEFGLPAVPRLAPVAVPRCLVVAAFDAERSWTGREMVDVAAWREYLEVRGFNVDVLELPLATGSDVGRMRKHVQPDHRFVVLTAPRDPKLLTDGLERGSGVLCLYRGAASGGRSARADRRADDLACARAADRLIVAGPADAAHYRAAGIPAGRLDYVPEFLPAIYRRLPRPYPARPRQVVVHFDAPAVLEDRLRRHPAVRGGVAFLLAAGWRVVISAAPRLRTRIAEDLGLQELDPAPAWCDPSIDLPGVLHTTRLVLAPAARVAELGGLITAGRILGFRILVDDPAGTAAGGHLAALPRSMAEPGVLDRLDSDPGGVDMEAVRAEAFRSLDRVLGFRDAGWQEGRDDRSADI